MTCRGFSKYARVSGLHWVALSLAAGVALVGCNTPAPSDNTGDNDNSSTTDKPIIVTVAGTGTNGLNGDGPVEDTQFYFPQDSEIGPDGLLYIVDWNNHRIRRINEDNTVETLVGTGDLTGDLQEEGLAKEAKLNHPTHICFEPDGSMLIAAWHNSQLTRVTWEDGMNRVIAGVGGREYGGDGGPAKEAHLNLPSSIVVDSQGNIIFSDQSNQRVRRINTDGTIVTVCGNGEQAYAGDGGPAVDAKINSPAGQASAPGGRLAIDLNDNIYVCDTGNHVIRKIDSAGYITTVAGNGTAGYSGDGGPATAAQLNTPSDVEADANGNLYIADTFNNVIRKVDASGVITTIVGTGEPDFSGDGGPADEAALNHPYGVNVAPNGDLYVADTYNSRVRLVTLSDVQTIEPPDEQEVVLIPCTDEPGSICTYAGTGYPGFNGDGKHRTLSNLYWPLDIEFTPSGKVYVIDWNNHKIREILADGTFQTVIGSEFIGDGPPDFSDLYPPPGALGTTVSLNHNCDLLELPTGELVATVWHNHKIRIYDPQTGMVEVAAGNEPAYVDNVPAYQARMNLPCRSVLDDDGNFWTLDQKNWRLRVIENFAEEKEQGLMRSIIGNGTWGYSPDGTDLANFAWGWKGGPNPEPTGGIVWDSARQCFYIADSDNSLIRKVVFTSDDWSSGEITTIAGVYGYKDFNGDGLAGTETYLNLPQDMELGPDGNLYFNDTNNYRVRRLNLTTGIVDTIAGTGEAGYSGDGGSALEATIDRSFGIAFDLEGDLYLSDTFNSRIRKIKMQYDVEPSN